MKKIKSLLFIICCIGCLNKSFSQTGTPELTALTNVTIIDVEISKALDNMTILIEGDKIKAIQASKSVELDGVQNIIDLNGRYVIPGLIDSHVHLFRPKNREEILTKLLFSGVTSVRDMGGDTRVYQNLNAQIEQGTLMGPDIYFAATIFGPTFLKDPRTKFAARGYEPGYAPWMRVIDNQTNLEQVVLEAKQAGVTGLKVYSNVSPELLVKLSNAAHASGLKMWSHSSIYPSKPSDAVMAKVDVISHGIGMIFELENNMPLSFNEAIRSAVPLQDFENTNALAPQFVALFKNMKTNDLIFEPTLSAWSKKLRTQRPKIKSTTQNPNPTSHLATAATKMDVVAMDNWVKRITKAAYNNGVLIAAGTDLNTNIMWVQDEIVLLTQCGLSNIDAIKAATLNGAKAIGIEDSHGSITVGKKANLVILSKNPLENIENIQSVLAVYKNGKEYKKIE